MPPVRDARHETTTSYSVAPKASLAIESTSPTVPNATVASGNNARASASPVLPPIPDLGRTNAVTS
jgi:hypothetical protein